MIGKVDFGEYWNFSKVRLGWQPAVQIQPYRPSAVKILEATTIVKPDKVSYIAAFESRTTKMVKHIV